MKTPKKKNPGEGDSWGPGGPEAYEREMAVRDAIEGPLAQWKPEAYAAMSPTGVDYLKSVGVVPPTEAQFAKSGMTMSFSSLSAAPGYFSPNFVLVRLHGDAAVPQFYNDAHPDVARAFDEAVRKLNVDWPLPNGKWVWDNWSPVHGWFVVMARVAKQPMDWDELGASPKRNPVGEEWEEQEMMVRDAMDGTLLYMYEPEVFAGMSPRGKEYIEGFDKPKRGGASHDGIYGQEWTVFVVLRKHPIGSERDKVVDDIQEVIANLNRKWGGDVVWERRRWGWGNIEATDFALEMKTVKIRNPPKDAAEVQREFETLLKQQDPHSLNVAQDLLLESGQTLYDMSVHVADPVWRLYDPKFMRERRRIDGGVFVLGGDVDTSLQGWWTIYGDPKERDTQGRGARTRAMDDDAFVIVEWAAIEAPNNYERATAHEYRHAPYLVQVNWWRRARGWGSFIKDVAPRGEATSSTDVVRLAVWYAWRAVRMLTSDLYAGSNNLTNTDLENRLQTSGTDEDGIPIELIGGPANEAPKKNPVRTADETFTQIRELLHDPDPAVLEMIGDQIEELGFADPYDGLAAYSQWATDQEWIQRGFDVSPPAIGVFEIGSKHDNEPGWWQDSRRRRERRTDPNYAIVEWWVNRIHDPAHPERKEGGYVGEVYFSLKGAVWGDLKDGEICPTLEEATERTVELAWRAVQKLKDAMQPGLRVASEKTQSASAIARDLFNSPGRFMLADAEADYGPPVLASPRQNPPDNDDEAAVLEKFWALLRDHDVASMDVGKDLLEQHGITLSRASRLQDENWTINFSEAGGDAGIFELGQADAVHPRYADKNSGYFTREVGPGLVQWFTSVEWVVTPYDKLRRYDIDVLFLINGQYGTGVQVDHRPALMHGKPGVRQKGGGQRRFKDLATARTYAVQEAWRIAKYIKGVMYEPTITARDISMVVRQHNPIPLDPSVNPHQGPRNRPLDIGSDTWREREHAEPFRLDWQYKAGYNAAGRDIDRGGALSKIPPYPGDSDIPAIDALIEGRVAEGLELAGADDAYDASLSAALLPGGSIGPPQHERTKGGSKEWIASSNATHKSDIEKWTHGYVQKVLDMLERRNGLRENPAMTEDEAVMKPNPTSTNVPIPNPPTWVTQQLANSWVTLEEKVPPEWLPKLAQTMAKGKKMVAEIPEYGCGVYGCVFPTLDPAVVMKVTTDDSEAEFVEDLAEKVPPNTVTRYEMGIELCQDKKKLSKHQRNVYLLWRESAEHVGDVNKVLGAKVEAAIDKQHGAAQVALKEAWAVNQGKGSARSLAEGLATWLATVSMLAKISELTTMADGMRDSFLSHGIFFGDVHGGNMGLASGKWVITDPGNVVVVDMDTVNQAKKLYNSWQKTAR